MVCCNNENNNNDLVECSNEHCYLRWHRPCLKHNHHYSQSELARISRKREPFYCPQCVIEQKL